jgi:aspartate aminotransferase-like enzyme
MSQSGSRTVLKLDLHQVDAVGRATRKAAGGQPQAIMQVPREAHPRAKTRPTATRLDLDDHQGLALAKEEIELGPARLQASREEPPTLGAQRALDEALAEGADARIERVEARERASRREERVQRAPEVP